MKIILTDIDRLYSIFMDLENAVEKILFFRSKLTRFSEFDF